MWIISLHYLMMKERKWNSDQIAERILDMEYMFDLIKLFIVGWRKIQDNHQIYIYIYIYNEHVECMYKQAITDVTI